MIVCLRQNEKQRNIKKKINLEIDMLVGCEEMSVRCFPGKWLEAKVNCTDKPSSYHISIETNLDLRKWLIAEKNSGDVKGVSFTLRKYWN